MGQRWPNKTAPLVQRWHTMLAQQLFVHRPNVGPLVEKQLRWFNVGPLVEKRLRWFNVGPLVEKQENTIVGPWLGQRWPNKKCTVGPTLARDVGPTAFCPSAQRWDTGVKTTALVQRWPISGKTSALVQRWSTGGKQHC